MLRTPGVDLACGRYIHPSITQKALQKGAVPSNSTTLTLELGVAGKQAAGTQLLPVCRAHPHGLATRRVIIVLVCARLGSCDRSRTTPPRHLHAHT